MIYSAASLYNNAVIGNDWKRLTVKPRHQILRWVGFALCLAGCAGALTAAAPGDSGVDQMQQQEVRQGQIKTTTQRVAEQLAAVISEFERNAIEGEDVKALRAIRGVLGRLSERDMQQVIQWLHQARENANPKTAARSATDAYAGQRSIISQLNQLVLEHQRQQALYELSLRFKEFAERQAANMWLGVALAKETEGKTLTGFSEAQESSLRVQQIDQENLREEVRLALEQLEKLAREITDGPAAGRPKLALEQAQQGGLHPALDGAVENLKTGLMGWATGQERRARDQLRDISRLLLLSQDGREVLRQALREVEQTIDQQQAVAKDTRTIDQDDTAKVQPRQAQVVDQADVVRRDVQSLAPLAAERLKDAIAQMHEAGAVFNEKKEPQARRDQAPPKQEAALASLEQARQALREQLAKAEAMARAPANNLEALRNLQAQVRTLAKAEEQLKTDAAAAEKKDLTAQAARQGELKNTARDLQQKAGAAASPAAASMGEAADQMQKAQASLAAGENNPAAQQAAMDALNQAGQQLDQDIAKLEQVQKELAQLEALKQKLLPVIQEQQKVQFGTAKEALNPAPKTSPELSDRQGKLAADTGQLRQDSSAPAPAAAARLDSARNRMETARNQLNNSTPKGAQPEQTEALADLHSAKREMEQRINELRDSLGLEPLDQGQSLADAEARIQQARRETEQAISQMQQAPPGMLDTLAQQQRQISGSLGNLGPGAAGGTPVSQARQAAERAAQQLGRADLANAVESMRAAQNALQQAQPANQDKAPSAPPKPPASGEAPPTLPQLQQQQQEARQIAESMLQQLKAAPDSALQQAGQSLENAGSALSPVTAGELGQLPRSVQAVLQNAQSALADSAAQASAGQAVPAHSQASNASWALAQAQAALALARDGMGSESMMAQGNQGQNQGQGQGKGQGQGQAQGQGQGKGQGKGAAAPGQSSGQGAPGAQGSGRQGNWAGPGGAEGPQSDITGTGRFIGLPARDRAAILQSQSEKYPQEYGPLVEQYLKNLSDQAGGKN